MMDKLVELLRTTGLGEWDDVVVRTVVLGAVCLVVVLVLARRGAKPATKQALSPKAPRPTQTGAGAGAGAGADVPEHTKPHLSRAQVKALAAQQARAAKAKGVVPKHTALVRALKGHKKPTTCCSFSPDGRYIATAGEGGRINVWQVSSFAKAEPRCLRATLEYDWVTALAFSEDGKVLACATADAKEVVVFKVTHKADPVERRRFRTGHTNKIERLYLPTFRLLPDSLFIVTCAAETIAVHDRGGRLLQSVKPQHGAMTAVSINRDATLMTVAGASTTEAKVWSIEQENRAFKKMEKAMVLATKSMADVVTGVSSSRDGLRLATCCRNGRWQLWDTAVEYKRFSEDPRLVLDAVGTVRAPSYTGHNGLTGCTLQEHNCSLIALSPNAKVVCLAGATSLAFVDAATGTRLGEAIQCAPANPVVAVDFGPQGRYVLTVHKRQQYCLLWAAPPLAAV